MGITTVMAGVLSIENIFWPLTNISGKQFQGYMDSALMAIFIAGVILVAGDAVRRIWKTLHGTPIPEEAFGASDDCPPVHIGCC